MMTVGELKAAFCNQTGDDTSAPANSKYQTSDENQEIISIKRNLPEVREIAAYK